MSLFTCQSCGHIEFDLKPDECPVCASNSLKQDDAVFEESARGSKEASAKHVPMISISEECGLVSENDCRDIVVRIGEVLHPMEEKHFIQFIDCYVDKKYVARAFLTPGLNPVAFFNLKLEGTVVSIVENCTLHGYWLSEKIVAD